MKSTKKFTLKQLASYGGITAVVGGAVAGIAVGISNNTEETLLLKGQSEHDKWSSAFYSDDVLAGKTKFYPAFEVQDGKLYENKEYSDIAISPAFRVATTRHPDLATTGLYVTNGFRVETGDANEYDAKTTSGTVAHLDYNFTKLFGYEKGNADFISAMNELLAAQTSSLILDKAFKIRVDTSDKPFYPTMENSAGLGVGTFTLEQVTMVSVAFCFKTVLLDFAEKYSSSTEVNPINKLANEIVTSLPSEFPESLMLHSWISQRKNQIENWMKDKFTLPGTNNKITFSDYLKKAVLYQTVRQIVEKSYSNAISQNIDISRKYEGKDLPDTLKNIYEGLDTINSQSMGANNHNGYMGSPELLAAIKGLSTFEDAGKGRPVGEDTELSLSDDQTYNNFIGSATSSKRWMFDETKNQFVEMEHQYNSFPTDDLDNRYLQGWRNAYDRTFVHQKGLVLEPQIAPAFSDTLSLDPSNEQKTGIENIVNALKEAAKFNIDYEKAAKKEADDFATAKKEFEDKSKDGTLPKDAKAPVPPKHTPAQLVEDAKHKAATVLIAGVFDGPAESRPSNEEILGISYDQTTNKITADLNVPSKVYFQTLFNDLHDGVKGDDNINQLTKSLDKRFTPLLWNNGNRDSLKEVSNDDPTLSGKEAANEGSKKDGSTPIKQIYLKDINGKEISGSNITISFINKDNVKTMAAKAIEYMYTDSNATKLKPTIFNNAGIYQQAEKKLIKNLIGKPGDENQITEDSTFSQGSYFVLDNKGDIPKKDGVLQMNSATIGYLGDNILAVDTVAGVMAKELAISTFKLPKGSDYNYAVSYLDDVNKFEVAGKQIIDPASGDYTTKFKKDSYTLLAALNKESESLVTGVTTMASSTSNNIAGYQIIGLAPKDTKVGYVTLGGTRVNVHMVPNVGGIMQGPGKDYETDKVFDKDMWITDVFNVGNYDNSIMEAIKSENIDEHKYALKVYKEVFDKRVSRQKVPSHKTATYEELKIIQTKFDVPWSDRKGFFAVAEMPYVLTSDANQIYVSVFDNRKGV